MSSAITLLGPQHTQPSVDRVLRELGVRGPAAVITAGWQEREDDPTSLPDLGIEAVNLTLHARADDAFRKDPELAVAKKARQSRLKLMQDFYRVRLDHAYEAARAISVRHVDPALLADEATASLAVVRQLDQEHFERCRAVRTELRQVMPSAERDAVATHRRELAALIEPTDVVVIAGGHIAVLLNRIRMFDIVPLFGGRRIVAWSAGAMALTERVVLFHDNPPHGEGIAEVLDEGLGLAPGLVVLPEPRLRLRLDDPARVAQYALRFAPAACLALDHTARITIDGALARATGIKRLTADGTVDPRWP